MRVTPRAGADRIDRAAPDAQGRPLLQLRVRAAPQGGKANAAVESLIAMALGLGKRDVRVVQGGKARIKQVEIKGAGPDALARLAEVMGDER